MKKKSKLLKVVSIILIIFSALGILGGIFSLLTYSVITSTLESMGMAALPLWSYIVSLAISCINLVAGIAGVRYRSKQSVLTIGIVYCLSVIVSIAVNIILAGFSATYVLSLILPILYMWGWYQSE